MSDKMTIADIERQLAQHGQALSMTVLLELPGGAGLINVSRNLEAAGVRVQIDVVDAPPPAEA